MVTHSQSMYSLPVTVKRVFGVVAAAAMALTSGALMTGQAVADDSTEAFRANAQLAAAVDYYRSTAGDYQSFLHTPAIAERPVRDAVNGTSDNLTLDDAGGRYDTDTRYYVTYRYTLQPGRALSVTVSNADDDDISLWRMFTLAVHQDGVPADQADSLIIHDRSNGGVGEDGPVHSFSGGFRWDANHRGQTAVDWIKNGNSGASVDSIYNRVCALTGAPQNVGAAGPVYNIPRGSDSETLGVRNSTNSAQTITVSVLPGTLERRSGGNGTWNVSFSEGSFTDVNSGTAHAADIEWLASSGISTGYGDGSFGVGQQVQRQDMAAFLYRLAGNPSFTPSAEDKARFSDVNENTAHAKEVWWLASTGISTGYADGTFGVGKMVQRQDMAAFLHRFAGKFGGPAESGAGIAFTDVNGSTAHAEDIAWLAKTGISTGYPDHTFGVGQPVQRQDMAAFLHRIKTNALPPAPDSDPKPSEPVMPSGTYKFQTRNGEFVTTETLVFNGNTADGNVNLFGKGHDNTFLTTYAVTSDGNTLTLTPTAGTDVQAGDTDYQKWASVRTLTYDSATNTLTETVKSDNGTNVDNVFTHQVG